MKKIYILIIIIHLLSTFTNGQGINFEQGNWNSVREKAKQENKIIFIDFYTSWCAPCKAMAKNIFPQKEIGDFYNKHFVNFKIDVEKEKEGPPLAKKYGVSAFPTFIFTDANGKFLHQGVGGMDLNEFIELGKTAMDPANRLEVLVDKANHDKIKKKDMPDHLRELSSQRLAYNDKYEAYINSLSHKELISKETYNLMLELGGWQASGFSFEIILKNKDKYSKLLGEEELNRYFYEKYLLKAYEVKRSNESYESVLKEIKENDFSFADQVNETVILTSYNYDGEYDLFLKEAPVYLEKYADEKTDLIYNPVFIEAAKFYHQTPEMKAYCLQLAEKLIDQDFRVTDVYASLGKREMESGNLQSALKYYQKASEYLVNHEQDNYFKSSIEYIQEKITVKEKGDYIYHIRGLEEYNGGVFQITIVSNSNIGEYIEMEPARIEGGECILKGNVAMPTMAYWALWNGDDFKGKGEVVFEPGEFNVQLVAGDLQVENSLFNYYLFQGINEFPEYKKVSEELNLLIQEEDDLDDNTFLEKRKKLLQEQYDTKFEYYKYLYEHNPNTEVKILAFFVGCLWFEDESGEEVKALDAKYGNHPLVKTIVKIVAGNKERARMRATLTVGKQIKPFEAEDINGEIFKLEDVIKKNKCVLVEFWASWCGPCRAAIPHLKETYEKYSHLGFEIVSFSMDEKEDWWRKASEKEKLPWINTSDLKGRKSPIAKMYGISGIPTSFLVNRSGKIQGVNLHGTQLNELIESIVKQ